MSIIYVYQGRGASAYSAEYLKFSLTMGLQNWDFDVRYITADQIKQGRMLNVDRVSTLVIGGGAFTQAKAALGEQGILNIQSFVKDGGGYCGVCMGAYGAFADIEFNGAVAVKGRGLGIFNTNARGHLSITPPYDGTALSATIIQLRHLQHDVAFPSTYWGGFDIEQSQIEAMGATPLSSLQMPDGSNRILSLRVDRGNEGNPIFLSGHHFEASNRLMIWKWLTSQASSNTNNVRLKQEIESHDPKSYLMGLACAFDDMQYVPEHSFVQALLSEGQRHEADIKEKPVTFKKQASPLILQ